jgi:predicted lipoprotein with Yx(FWY)xxD motif
MSSDFGRVLDVGAGPRAGCSLYTLTSDQPSASPPSYACTGFCATHIWLALLTNGAPLAGPGVNPTLLGTVTRTDILSGMAVQQVTYAGQPVYAYSFDAAPGQTNGADLFDRFTTPPGVWYLVSPARGLPAPGEATLSKETVTIDSTGNTATVLAARMNSASGEQLFPVYTFSSDTGHQSACQGMCAVFWPPVLTDKHPDATDGGDRRDLGIIVRPDGSHQVTAADHPLYLFIRDAGTPGVANGAGHLAFGGTFNLVPAS